MGAACGNWNCSWRIFRLKNLMSTSDKVILDVECMSWCIQGVCKKSNICLDLQAQLKLHVIMTAINLLFQFLGHRREKQKALSPAAVLENLRHTLVDYQNRCSNATAEVRMD